MYRAVLTCEVNGVVIFRDGQVCHTLISYFGKSRWISEANTERFLVLRKLRPQGRKCFAKISCVNHASQRVVPPSAIVTFCDNRDEKEDESQKKLNATPGR